MAQLKNTLIQGSARVTDTLYANTLKGDLDLDYVQDAADLKAIEALTGTAGFLKKTAANTWSLDNSTYSKTDTHVNVSLTGAAISHNYLLMTSTAPTSTAAAHTALGATSLWVNSADKGKFELVLGNATATTSTGGQYGQLAFYSTSTAGTYLKAEAGTAWKTATLQAKDGTIALTSDIPTNLNQLTNGPGYITASSDITGTAANVTGTVAIANGGTGKTTAAEAWTALGGGAAGKHADNYFVQVKGNAGKSNMNDVGKMWPSTGMTSLTSTSNVDTPKNGDTYASGWHLYWDTCYHDDPSGSNAWAAQIINTAGTSNWWVRSRSGGKITNGTAWTSNWRHLVTSTEAAVGEALQPVYINANGEATACTFKSLGDSHPNNFYSSTMTYTNSTAPTTDWYVQIELNRTWDANLTNVILKANYSNHISTIYLNLNAHDGEWSCENAVYGGASIKSIKVFMAGAELSRHLLIQACLAAPTAYNGSTPPGNITVYAPVSIVSITKLDTAPTDLITLKRGYNTTMNIVAPTIVGSLTGNATTATTASNLTNFKVTTTTNLGIDAPGTNAIGYVSGLTRAAWNYQQTDGSLYTQFYSANWISEIFQDYRTGQISVRAKNNGTWQSWRRVLDETNGATILGLGSAAYTASTAYATSDHAHGNITNGGCITTAITVANGDYLIIGDTSASGKLGKGPAFVSTTANKFLKDTGAFTAIAAADLPAATTSAKGAVIVGSGLAVSSGTISINGINTSSGSTAKCLTEKGTWASFTNNAGTVKSITLKAGTNITLDTDNTAITESGTRTISLSSVQNPLTAASSAAAVTSSPYKSSRWAFNLGITAANLTTGMMITVKIPQPTNTYGSYVSIDNGTTYKPIAVGTGKGRMTTHYAQNNIITLFYDSAGTVTTYALNGAASTSDVTGGCWRVLNYYDSGNTTTTVRQSLDTTNKNRPLILAYDDNTVTTVNRDYQTYRCNAIYANPSTGHLYATAVHNAVWNDYAEYRKAANNPEPGRVVIDNDNGTMTLATQRLIPGAQVISDTWGHVMGETDDAKTPIAVAGRVLVYTFQSRKNYHAGMAVCSAPDGTVDIMTREEIRNYPDCIVGIVSEIPDYEEWGSGHVKVNGRIWIKVK